MIGLNQTNREISKLISLVALRRLDGHYTAWERPQVDKSGKLFAEPENILETATDSIGSAFAKAHDGLTDVFQSP